ncbi:MAG: tryptophan--tRNA ligase [Acidobacteria bacterium]|nr:tryptophan--tRNA ligase [Acidobacteriota bacterium]
MKKRIFSGAQPTGSLHIGNYLGALRNWVDLQDEYESFYCIVNLHAITLAQDPAELRQKTLDLARIYLAAGIDPEVSTIFIQSDVTEHAELAWTLSCIARMGELERMTQFKDKTQKAIPASSLAKTADALHQKACELARRDPPAVDFADILVLQNILSFQSNAERAGVGLFTYPVLMAADILLYQTHLVPVGKDQKQHLELSRDLADRFNRDYGKAFVVPEPFIPPVGANILSLQDPSKKMSKSDDNPAASIFLLDDADTIAKKIKRAVTDSGSTIVFDETRPAIHNLLTIYHLMTGRSANEIEVHFRGKGYGHLKSELADAVVAFLKPFQERVKDFDDAHLNEILKRGAEKARVIARTTLDDVYKKMGIVGAG